jgi:hypothetical protein
MGYIWHEFCIFFKIRKGAKKMKEIRLINPSILFSLFLFSGIIGCRGYHLKGNGKEDICSQLIIDNQGIPEWYPDVIPEDKTRFNEAKKEAERFKKTYNLPQKEIEICNSTSEVHLCLYNYIYTPSYDYLWDPLFRELVSLEECDPRDPEITQKALNKFISKWETFLGIKEGITYKKTRENCTEFPQPELPTCRFYYQQDYCGLHIVLPYQNLGTFSISARSSFAWNSCTLFRIDSKLVPLLVKVPKNPIMTKEEIHQGLIGKKITWYDYEGNPQEVIIPKDTPIEFGKKGVFFKGTKEGIEVHLVQEVKTCQGVTQEGRCKRRKGKIISSQSIFIDLLTGEILFIRPNF